MEHAIRPGDGQQIEVGDVQSNAAPLFDRARESPVQISDRADPARCPTD